MKLEDIRINQRVLVITAGFGDFQGHVCIVKAIDDTGNKPNITLKDNGGGYYDKFGPDDIEPEELTVI